MSKKIADAVSAIVGDLKGLSAEERVRAVRAALTIYGDQGGLVADKKGAKSISLDVEPPEDDGGAVEGISANGRTWMKKNGVSAGRIEEVFDISKGKATLILGEAIGKTKREQTINTFILTGLASLLATGDPSFTDDDARNYCINLGCYDESNHAKYVKEFGNKMTGNKKTGWKLTAPGIKAAAALLMPGTKAD